MILVLENHETDEKLIFTSNEARPYVFQRKTSSQDRMTSATLQCVKSINYNTYSAPGLMVPAFHIKRCYW